jgi:hypothetical protein
VEQRNANLLRLQWSAARIDALEDGVDGRVIPLWIVLSQNCRVDNAAIEATAIIVV